MREFAPKQNSTQKDNSIKPEGLRKAIPTQGSETPANAILQLQRTIGNQAVSRMLKSLGPNAQQEDYSREAARRGIAGPAEPLPHLDAIQQLFGHHDVSGVKAHTDEQAVAANQELNAAGYTTGNEVAFAGSPDLHTAAHEAAHVVQQQSGVHLAGGMGQAGDAYERHADAVADLVVHGKSAESLLSEKGGDRRSDSNTPPIPGSFSVLQKQEDPGKKTSLSSVTTFHATPAPGAMDRAPERGPYQHERAGGQSAKSLFKSLLDALDRLEKKLKGDAPHDGPALFFWGSATSSEHSTAAKPGKNVYFLNENSFDVTEVIELMNLCLLSVSSRAEMFPQPKNFKDVVKGLVKLGVKAKKLQKTLEEEEKKKRTEEAPQKKDEAQTAETLKAIQDIKKELGQIDLSPLESDKTQSPLKKESGGQVKKGVLGEFTVPSQDGKPEPTRYGEIYMKATDGSGLFSLDLNLKTSTFTIKTYFEKLYSLGVAPADQIFDRYPKGYKYIYAGDPNLMRLLPGH